MVISEPQQAQHAHQSTAGYAAAASPPQPMQQELRVNKSGGRRWGPQATQPSPSAAPALPAGASSSTFQQSTASRPSPQASPARQQQHQQPSPAVVVDPAQQRLAASLFGSRSGGGGGGKSAVVGIGSSSRKPAEIPKSPEIDLLGDVLGMETAPAAATPSGVNTNSLFALDSGPSSVAAPLASNASQAAPTGDPMAALAGLNMMSGFGTLPPRAVPASGALDLDFFGGLGTTNASASAPPVPPMTKVTAPVPSPMKGAGGSAPRGPTPSQDPFANLLG